MLSYAVLCFPCCVMLWYAHSLRSWTCTRRCRAPSPSRRRSRRPFPYFFVVFASFGVLAIGIPTWSRLSPRLQLFFWPRKIEEDPLLSPSRFLWGREREREEEDDDRHILYCRHVSDSTGRRKLACGLRPYVGKRSRQKNVWWNLAFTSLFWFKFVLGVHCQSSLTATHKLIYEKCISLRPSIDPLWKASRPTLGWRDPQVENLWFWLTLKSPQNALLPETRYHNSISMTVWIVMPRYESNTIYRWDTTSLPCHPSSNK